LIQDTSARQAGKIFDVGLVVFSYLNIYLFTRHRIFENNQLRKGEQHLSFPISHKVSEDLEYISEL